MAETTYTSSYTGAQIDAAVAWVIAQKENVVYTAAEVDAKLGSLAGGSRSQDFSARTLTATSVVATTLIGKTLLLQDPSVGSVTVSLVSDGESVAVYMEGGDGEGVYIPIGSSAVLATTAQMEGKADLSALNALAQKTESIDTIKVHVYGIGGNTQVVVNLPDGKQGDFTDLISALRAGRRVIYSVGDTDGNISDGWFAAAGFEWYDGGEDVETGDMACVYAYRVHNGKIQTLTHFYNGGVTL